MKNGYFQLGCGPQGTGLKVFAPKDGGEVVNVKEVMEYLTRNQIPYDTPALSKGLQNAAASRQEIYLLMLNRETCKEVNESYSLLASEDRMSVIVRFYPASENGESLKPQELIRDLTFKRITYGVRRNEIFDFLSHVRYCTDLQVAAGKAPRNGSDARIEYYFQTDKKARPTLKEDGSVDFFHLNTINHCKKGDVLARLYPEDRGEAGSTVYGEKIPPREVKAGVLHYGRNISISEDKTVLTAETDGHVMLVEGSVFVSDVLEVENVDTSTGNLDYEGSVRINGNVCANFEVRARGDIEVTGIVEGAGLFAGGNIIIARGMNGMAKGELQAGGNIVAKFLENARVSAGGSVSTESILHSRVTAGTQIVVTGKRGFITGGKVCATSLIQVKTLGSPMGTDTVVEVGMDPLKKARLQELQKQVTESSRMIAQIQPVLAALSKKMAQGVKLRPDQLKGFQEMVQQEKQLKEIVANNNEELTGLQSVLQESSGAKVEVSGEVYAGTKICISDVSLVVKESMRHCKFKKEQGDVKMSAL